MTGQVSRHDTRIRWGILSTGHIASVLTRDLALLPDEAEVIAVGSRGLDKAQRFANDYEIPRAYGSYAELAADPDVDVIYVASTHNDHLASARLCLESGKAVLVEKPLTVSAAETDDLLQLARERGLFVMEALWSRTNPLYRQAAEIVRSGIQSVDKGQVEAAGALGMTPRLTMGRIVLPQAMRVVIPPTGNEFINMLKTSSLAYSIQYMELLQAAVRIYSTTLQVIEMLLTISIWYLVLTSVFSVGQYYLERHFTRAEWSGGDGGKTVGRTVLDNLKFGRQK